LTETGEVCKTNLQMRKLNQAGKTETECRENKNKTCDSYIVASFLNFILTADFPVTPNKEKTFL